MTLNARRSLTIVLAAGEGVRMRSGRPKVLHELAGRSMLAHALSAVLEGAAGEIAVVVAAFITLDGESHWLEGVQLLALYGMIVAAAWFI